MKPNNNYKPATLVSSRNTQIKFLENFSSVLANDMLLIQKAVAGAGQEHGNIKVTDLAVVIGGILGVIKASYAIVGDGGTKDFTINHNKGDDKVFAFVYKDYGDGARIEPTIKNVDADNIKVVFSLAPLLGENYYVVVI